MNDSNPCVYQNRGAHYQRIPTNDTQCFGVAVSYLVIVGDLMPLAVKEWAGHDSDGMSVCVCTPFLMDRRLGG